MLTYNEFINSVVSDYDGIELTEKDFLEIGSQFTQKVKRTERNWKALTEALSYPYSHNTFRIKVYEYNKEKLEVGTQTNPLTSKQPTSDLDTEIATSEAQFQEDYKIITKNRDILNTYRRKLRDDARVESLKDGIIEAIKNLKPIEVPSMQIAERSFVDFSSDVEAVALLSDLHLGCCCDNFYNKYNYEIASERLTLWAEQVVKYCLQNNVIRLNILNLGDMIHGNIHTTGRIEAEMDLIDQITKSAELLATTLAYIAKNLDCDIIYRSCTDNHSRATANYRENIEEENFYRITDWYLHSRLDGTGIRFQESTLDKSMGLFELINGKKFAFAHGHHDNINTAFQNFIGATKQFIDYVALGHFHCEKSKNYQGFRVFVNGSIVGPEQYAVSRRLFDSPSQKLLIFNENDIVDISIKLDK